MVIFHDGFSVTFVIPAKAGIHGFVMLDSSLHLPTAGRRE